MSSLIGLTFGIATLALSTQASADFHDGVRCYQKGDMECATREFRPVAEGGNTAAQYLLGMIYLNELASPPADEGAEAWLLRAAEQENIQAQSELARMYRDGDGVDKNFAQMSHWYERAAENGDVGAQLMVADTYAWGDLTNPRYEDAYMWYTIAIKYWGTHAERARDAMENKLDHDGAKRAVDRARVWLKAREAEE